MIHPKLYLNIIIRVVLISITSIITSFIYTVYQDWYLLLFFTSIAAIQTLSLINFIKKTNKTIADFFLFAKNGEKNIRSYKSKNQISHALINSLEEIYATIQNLRLESEKREQYFGKVFEMITTGIMIVGKNGDIEFHNNALKKMINRKQILNINQFRRLSPDFYHSLDSIRNGQKKIIKISSNSSMSFLLKANNFIINNSPVRVFTLDNIKQELDEREQESWRRLVKIFNHEISNSMSPIVSTSRAICDLLKENFCENPYPSKELSKEIIADLIHGLEMINEIGAGIHYFVTQVKSLDSIPDPKCKDIMVKDFIFNLINMSEKSGWEHIQIEQKLEPEEVAIFADKELISLVFINIIKNSCEALQTTKRPKILISNEETSEYSIIHISDNGSGISENELEEIFVPFYTTRKSGTGIGLSLSRQIMHLHGGKIEVQSKPYHETTLSLFFPKIIKLQLN
ncbi:MAG: HAMP domain-containing histidine kinase [Bacteroidetes bacterium]|nr:HAMP domain-containing histidine kinase [Bacteroidota bacterium]